MNVPEPGAILRRVVASIRPTIWQRRGILVWNLQNSAGEDVHTLAGWGRRYGFKVCAIKVHDGTSAYRGAHGDNLRPELWQVLRDAGWTVGAWGWNASEPEREVQLLSDLYALLRFSFYIADAEAPYEYSLGPGRFSPEQYGRSRRFTRSFRAVFPQLPAALTSYGLVSLHDIDWAAWRRADFRWLPQAYRNESQLLTPAACVQDGTKFWPRSWVHPMIAAYAGALGKLPDADWVRDLADARSLGFTIFPASGLAEPDYAIYSRSRSAL